MSESTILDTVLQATETQELGTQDEAQELDAQDEAQEAPPHDERQLNALLRKAENAFTRGNKGLLPSRVECGRWCHAVYVLRGEQGHKDRSFTSQLIFNRLAVHADSKRECDASELAKMFKAIELLAADDAWKALTVGKLYDMLPLVSRVDGTENHMIFDGAKAEQAKMLFTWACGDGISKPSREDIHNRVLELTTPRSMRRKWRRTRPRKRPSRSWARTRPRPRTRTSRKRRRTSSAPKPRRARTCRIGRTFPTAWPRCSGSTQTAAGSFGRHDARFRRAIRVDNGNGERTNCRHRG